MKIIQDWNEFWFRPHDLLTPAVFRIALGLIILIKLLLLFPFINDLFSEQGMYPLALSQKFVWPRLCLFDYLPLDIAPVFFTVMLIITVLFTCGLFTRVMSLLMYIGLVSIEYRNPLPFNSGDRIMLIFLFFGMFASWGETLSLDRWIAKRQGLVQQGKILGPFWATRMMQIQVCMMYFWSTYQKLQSVYWNNGEMMYWVLRNFGRTRFPLPSFFSENMIAVNLLTYFALAVEGLFPFLVWSKRTRKYIIPAGILMHLGIEWSMNIQIFEIVVLASYLLFFEGEELREFPRRCENFIKRVPQTHPPQRP